MNITPRKKQLLDYNNSYRKAHGFAPSIPEIAKRFKLAISTVHQHLEELEQGGYLKRERNQRRGIEIAATESMVHIPLLGIIAAGQPIEAIENREFIAVPKSKIPKTGNLFALRVSGESMIDEGIADGDVIIARKQDTAQNGDRVVALVDGTDATLKTYYRERGHIRLQPANKAFEPIIIPKNREFAIQGVVTEVVRQQEAPIANLPAPPPAVRHRA